MGGEKTSPRCAPRSFPGVGKRRRPRLPSSGRRKVGKISPEREEDPRSSAARALELISTGRKERNISQQKKGGERKGSISREGKRGEKKAYDLGGAGTKPSPVNPSKNGRKRGLLQQKKSRSISRLEKKGELYD